MGLFRSKKIEGIELAKLSPSQRAELALEAGAIAKCKASVEKLEAALGMLRLGHHYGWKVLLHREQQGHDQEVRANLR